jgi:shikimate dehydrogenase
MSRPISPHTALCGIVVHPAAHTRSPAMHNAAFEALGIDAVYLAFDVVPEGLVDAIAGARALGIRQLAVSIPHKVAVIGHLDEVDEIARCIGAVNTVTRRDGRLVGTNTDWIGVVRALERETSLAGRRAVVLGAGGTARAAVYGLLAAGCRVTVLNRGPDRARKLAEELGAHGHGPLADLARTRCDVIVQATPVGLGTEESPVDAIAIGPGTVVLDAVYEPEQTLLLRDAAARGAKPVSGKWMLVYQAVEQIRLWTGCSPNPQLLADAFDRVGPMRVGPARPGNPPSR